MTKQLNTKLIIIVLTIITNVLLGQGVSCVKQSRIAEYFVESYNQQNYSKMKKPFFTLAKLLPIKKALKNEFEPIFKKYGKAKIGAVDLISESKLVVELNYEKDLTEKDFLIFYFNKRSKITGLNFKSPDFTYPKAKTHTGNHDIAVRIDSVVKHKSSDGFNGCALVIENGREIYKKSFGYSNFETKQLLDENSLFELASCSKQFTGMAIMILSEQGKLEYSDTIQKYIPNFPYRNITIQNLLTHTSGLPDYMELLEKYWNKNKFASNYDVVDLFQRYKPKSYFSPNEDFNYSNTGYALLSIIIERASGLSYADFLDEYIFRKLKMKNTRVYNTRRSKKEEIPNYAYGYIYSNKKNKYLLPDSSSNHKYVIYMDAITGDGTVNSCISDLAIWDKALRESELVENTTIEKAYSIHKLKSGKIINYNFGQFLCVADTAERLLYHGGSWPGYSTFIVHFIDRQISIILLSNNEYSRVSQIADHIASILLGHSAGLNEVKER